MNKEIWKLLIILGLYSLSGGIFYNFQELWMAENNLSVQSISIVYSLCALLTVSTIFLCSNLVKQKRLKTFASALILLKAIIILSLFFLHTSGFNIAIKFLIMIDYIIDVEIYAVIYPMIAMISKNDKIYAARGIIYSFLYSLGIIITTFTLGKSIKGIEISYNISVLVGAILMFLAFFLLVNTNLKKYYQEDAEEDLGSLFKLLKIIKNDKISLVYFGYTMLGSVAYYSVLGLSVLLLTQKFNYSPVASSNINLALSICSAILGTIVLAFLDFKNHKISLGIKYIIRTFLFFIAFIFNIKILYLIAFFYPKIISDSYTQVTDAPYINRIDNKYQLAFCNLKEMASYAGRSIGTFFCGIAITWGLRYVYMLAFVFALMQCIGSYIALNLYEKERSEVK